MLPPSASVPPVEPELQPVTKTRSRWLTRLAPLAAGAVLVAAGGVFGVRALQGDGGKPEDPVEQLFSALDHEDLIGVLESLTPAERDILVGRSQRLAGELRRIGVADGSFDLSHLGGVDLQVSGLQLESTKVTDDLAEVRVVAGQLTSSVAVDQLPLGEDLRRLAHDDLDGGAGGSPAAEPQTEDLAAHDLRFMVLRRGGSWGLSLGYTIAEGARRDAGLDRPDFASSPVEAQGSATPEQAVEGLFRAVDDLDLPGVIGHLDPDEMAPLYDYAALYLPDPARSEELRSEAGQFTISDLQLHAEGSGAERRVKLSAATVTVDTPDVHAALHFADGCLHASFDRGDGSEPQVADWCANDPGDAIDSLGSEELSRLAGLFDASKLGDGSGIDVHQVDGAWYVSPTRTVLDGGIALLSAVKDGAVGEIVDIVSSGVGQLGAELDGLGRGSN